MIDRFKRGLIIKVTIMIDRFRRGLIILLLILVLLCLLTFRERKEFVSPYPCWKERHSLIHTKVVTTNTTTSVLDCIKRDDENSGLLSYFVPENFIDFQCPEVKVHFSNVNLSQVALASFPGSGNTWVRHLIEKMSGIATGSIYCGTKEMQSTFIGQCQKNITRTIVIKTHGGVSHRSPRSQQYDKAVLIIRNPFDALLADFNRINSGKQSVAPKQRFQSKAWATFVQRKTKRWKQHTYSWLVNFKGPRRVVFYEHLQSNMLEELVKLCFFLRTNSTISDIWCTVKDQEGMFHREKPEWLVPSSLFTDEMKAVVHSAIEELYKLMTYQTVSPDVRKNFDLFYRKR